MDPQTIWKNVIAPMLIKKGVEAADVVIEMFAVTVKATKPELTGDELVAEVDGAVKHYLRGKIGVLVDVLWFYGPSKAAIDAEIARVIASDNESIVAPEPAPEQQAAKAPGEV